MALANELNISTQRPSFLGLIMDFASATVNAVQDTLAKQAAFRATMDELQGLSDRELNDLGIARANIAQIAREGVYGK